ncbi:phage major capsid protein [Streptomyces sparsogenes]|uniref:Major capsid protein HK97 n=1 Tax=Streptomyces sparsogenes DSM 40356 TaxID=1331668 RepID=A0A1R1S812_9ACTN|nr:phage major capsid protein [Streptomyces sparsogenes]OMI34377.1 major capsid protein HK97 [Streptomyces sparsogenes DSM 40356]
MPTYNSLISRDASNDPLVPTPVSADIIEELPAASALLQRARRVPMSSKTQRQPVLDVLPLAYFVGGDTGLKQTSAQDWKNVDLVAEEIAAIVPIPEAYLDDAQMPIWNEVRPRLVEAIGAKLDAAGLFGLDKPSTWPTAVYQSAVAAGNAVISGTGTDFAVDVATAAGKVSEDGFAVNGFISRPGLTWKLNTMRSEQGVPIYQPNLQGGLGGTLYGYPMSELTNGAWDLSEAELLMGDWTKAIVGVRQDISFKLFTEGVISDDDGKVILNLMQQDSVAMRVVMRVAFATANPATRLNTNSATRSPFAVVQATTAAS